MGFDANLLSIVGPAFVAGLLVLATHVPLGMQVLARGIVFIDLAIAQVATLGVIAADRLDFEPEGWVAQAAAVAAALLGGLLLTWTEKRWPEIQEALIGVLFALGATGGMILVAGNPHGGEHLQDLLAGQILWVGWTQLAWVGALSAALVAAMTLMRKRAGRLTFYALFACAVTASVQLVGVFLVFASLIVPALATRKRTRYRLPVALATGASGYAFGLVGALLGDLPAGPVIVWALAGCGLLAHALAGGQRQEGQPPA